MSKIIQNESHLKKWVKLVETGHVSKKQLDFLKWVRFKEIGHTRKNGLCFLKMVHN